MGKYKQLYEDLTAMTVELTKNETSWKQFLSFASTYWKMPVDHILSIYNADPTPYRLWASYQLWNQIGRRIKSGEKGIPVLERNGDHFAMNHLFEVSQTTGYTIPITDWRTYQQHLQTNPTLAYTMFSKYKDQLKRMANEQRELLYDDLMQVIPTTHPFQKMTHGVKGVLEELLFQSAVYVIAKRLGFPDQERELLTKKMNGIYYFNSVKMVSLFNGYIFDATRPLLQEIALEVPRIQLKEMMERERESKFRTGKDLSGQVRQTSLSLLGGDEAAPSYSFTRGWRTDGGTAEEGRGDSGVRGRTDGSNVQNDTSTASDIEHLGSSPAPLHGDGHRGGNRPESAIVPEQLIETTEIINQEPTSRAEGSFVLPKIDKTRLQPNGFFRFTTQWASERVVEEIKQNVQPPEDLSATATAAAGNFRYQESYNLYPTGEKTKFKNNIQAIKTLKKIEQQNRSATVEEQITLAKYVGWGGLQKAFDSHAAAWEQEYQELKLILTEKEYQAAKKSVLTAYYTAPDVVKAMYDTLERFGYAGSEQRKILDTSMGTGNFFASMNDSFLKSELYGVEIDAITGRIAKQLYPAAHIQIKGFENTKFEPQSFDLVVGNVPFNDIRVHDPSYNEHNFLIHDYFLAKSMDLIKPGGMMAVIVSKGFMDKADSRARMYLAARADLVGAVRLPESTFRALAGTDVIADILFFKKLEQQRTYEHRTDYPAWVQSDFVPFARNRSHQINQYFIQQPEQIIGDMVAVSGPYGPTVTVRLPDPSDLITPLSERLQRLEATFDAAADEPKSSRKQEGMGNVTDVIDLPPDVRPYTFTRIGDDLFFAEPTGMTKVMVSAGLVEHYIALRDELEQLIDMQVKVASEEELDVQRRRLNQRYDAFVDVYGPVSSQKIQNTLKDDDRVQLVMSIEDEKDGVICKADIFTKTTIRPYRVPEHVESAEEAIAISRNVLQRVDVPFMAKLMQVTEDEAIQRCGERIYLDPYAFEGNPYEHWLSAEDYLSGYVKEKLAYAKVKAAEYPERFMRNVVALEQVQPVALQASDISYRMGSTWIDADIVTAFVHEMLEVPVWSKSAITVSYLDYASKWQIQGKNKLPMNIKNTVTYGTKRMNALHIIEDTLNLQNVTIKDDDPLDPTGKRKIINVKETMAARQKQAALKEKFSSWLFQDYERGQRLLTTYNERFNTIRPRSYDGSYIRLNQMNVAMSFRKHQVDFIARVAQTGTGLAAHVVGAGKTAAVIGSAMYLRQTGLAKKPMIVVPNHLTDQWAKEFYRFFPTAKLLLTTKKDFETARRNRFVSRIATGEYDAVIIGHSQFERIPISPELESKMIEREIEKLNEALQAITDKRGNRLTVKNIEKAKDRLEQQMRRLYQMERKDRLLTFEQLGVDMLFVDEAHHYKNLHIATKMSNVAGIGTSSSQRAMDMYFKTQYLLEKQHGRGVVFATGTPISNSMSELYNLQRYLQPQVLERMGLTSFDAWASTFGEVVSSLELTPEGNKFRMKNRFAKFHNLPELVNAFKQVSDIQTADMLKLPLPKLKHDKATIIVSEKSDFQAMVMDELVARAEAVQKKLVHPTEDNMLKITNDAKLMSIDPRLVVPDAPIESGSKLQLVIANVHKLWTDHQEKRLTQLVFSDSGTPKPNEFNVYDEIKSELVKLGVPANEVAFVHDAKNEKQREQMFDKVRKGDIRVLIGSTQKLGTGTNVQDQLIAVHHVDCPWRPSDIEQRDGRIVRQGNRNEEVEIYRYVTKGTFDGYLWQIQEQKLKYIGQVMTGKHISRSCDDLDETVLDAAEVKAIATGDPRLAEKMKVDNEVQRLKLLESSYVEEQYALKRAVAHLPASIDRLTQEIEQLTADQTYTATQEPFTFSIQLFQQQYTDRTAAAEVFRDLITTKFAAIAEEGSVIGEYRGFKLTVEKHLLWGAATANLLMQRESTHTIAFGESGLGMLQRMEHVIDKLEEQLRQAKYTQETHQLKLERALEEVNKPFEYRDQLSHYLARKAELDVALEMAQQPEDIVLDEDPYRDSSDTPSLDHEEQQRE